MTIETVNRECERIQDMPVPNVDSKPDIFYHPGVSAYRGHISLQGYFSCAQLRELVKLMEDNGGDL